MLYALLGEECYSQRVTFLRLLRCSLKTDFFEKVFCLVNNITVDVMSIGVLLVDHFKNKLYLITNQFSYEILRGISILVHKSESMFNFDLTRDIIAVSNNIMTHFMDMD